MTRRFAWSVMSTVSSGVQVACTGVLSRSSALRGRWAEAFDSGDPVAWVGSSRGSN
jgi:hypothetical protein